MKPEILVSFSEISVKFRCPLSVCSKNQIVGKKQKKTQIRTSNIKNSQNSVVKVSYIFKGTAKRRILCRLRFNMLRCKMHMKKKIKSEKCRSRKSYVVENVEENGPHSP